MASSPYGPGYELTLADGQSWHMAASDNARSWLDELARIMELRNGSRRGSKNVFFLRGQYSTPLEDLRSDNDVVPVDLPRDGWSHYKSSIETWYHDICPDVIINLGPVYKRNPESESDVTEEQHDKAQMSLSFFPFFRQCAVSGGMPIHAGLVSRDGRAVLLAAPGGTGKSTCCRRIPEPWHALGDDEALIVPTGPGTYHVHPFPTWSDYLYGRNPRTWNTGIHLPLTAIFFLEQAPADKVLPLQGGLAASFIFRSSMQAYIKSVIGMDIPKIREHRNTVFNNACELAKKIPAFRLQVSLTGEFWKEIEDTIPEFRH